jgi:hypothetical protein
MISRRSQFARALAVGVAVLVASVTVSAGAASADRGSVSDGRADMWKINEGGTEPWAAPAATIGDVLRTTVRHTMHRVVVRVRYADLAPTGKSFRLWVDIRDETDRVRIIGLDAPRRDRDGRVIFMTASGRDIDCSDVRHRIDYDRDITRLSVPRPCLDTPRTVQFRILTEHVRANWDFAWLDNGLAESMDDRSWTEPLRRG